MQQPTITDIQDQTLAIYLERTLGVKIINPTKEDPINLISEALMPGSTMAFSFHIPAKMSNETILKAIENYFEQTDNRVKPGEDGMVDDIFFWIFEDRHPSKHSGFEIGTSIRCTMNPRTGNFNVD